MSEVAPADSAPTPRDASTLPVAWSRYGRLSASLARLRPTAGPPVLVLSLPRSGSSWVGETLGFAPDALYLREPLSQGDPLFRRLGTVFSLEDRPDLIARHRTLADRAFAGCPSFPPEIVRFPDRWSWRDRPGRRVVVKEVNPLAGPWYASRYRPRVVFLVRHPVAVALSWSRKGWLDDRPDSWASHGRFQAETLQQAMAGLDARRDQMQTLQYETVCANPLRAFQSLYQFVGLTWTEAVASYVESHTGRLEPTDVFGTTRPSRLMPSSWRGRVAPELISAVRSGFGSIALPWYRSEADWSSAASAA